MALDLTNSGERFGAENNDTRVSLDQPTRLMALHDRCLVLADSRRERCSTSIMATTYSVCMCSGGPFGLRLHCLFSLPSGRSAGRSRERIAKVLDKGRPHDARCAAPALTLPLVGLSPRTLVHVRIALPRAMQRTAVFRRRRRDLGAEGDQNWYRASVRVCAVRIATPIDVANWHQFLKLE